MATSTSTPKDSPASCYALGVLMLAYILSFIDRNVMAVLIGPIREDFAISDTQFALLHGLAFTLFYTVMGLPIGRLADRRQRRVIITLGVLFWSLMTCLCGAVKSFMSLLVVRMGVGLGEAALSPPAHSMLSDMFSARRLPLAIAIFSLGVPLGAGMAYMIGGWVYGFFAARPALELPILGLMRPWQLTFFAVGLPGFVVVLLMLLVREPQRTGVRRDAGAQTDSMSIGQTVAYLLRHRAVYGAQYASISLLSILGYGVMTWYLEFMVRSFGADRSVLGPQFGLLFIIAGLAGTLSGGWLVSWLQRRGYEDANVRIITLVALAWLPPGVIGPLLPDPRWAFWAVMPPLFLINFYFGGAVAGLQLISPNQMRSQVSAILLFLTNLIGLGLGPLLVSFFTDYLFGGDQYLNYSLALVALLVCPAAAWLSWRGLRPYRDALRESQRW